MVLIFASNSKSANSFTLIYKFNLLKHLLRPFSSKIIAKISKVKQLSVFLIILIDELFRCLYLSDRDQAKMVLLTNWFNYPWSKLSGSHFVHLKNYQSFLFCLNTKHFEIFHGQFQFLLLLTLKVRDDCLSNIRINLQEKENDLMRQIKEIQVLLLIQ